MTCESEMVNEAADLRYYLSINPAYHS